MFSIIPVGKQIQRHHALFGLGGGDHRAVELRGAVPLTQSADIHEPISHHADAGDLFERACGIRRSAAGELVAADAIAHDRRKPALIEHRRRGRVYGSRLSPPHRLGDHCGVREHRTRLRGLPRLHYNIRKFDRRIIRCRISQRVSSWRNGKANLPSASVMFLSPDWPLMATSHH